MSAIAARLSRAVKSDVCSNSIRLESLCTVQNKGKDRESELESDINELYAGKVLGTGIASVTEDSQYFS